MMSILEKTRSVKISLAIVVSLLFFSLPAYSFGQERVSLSVTPTLIQMAGQPSQAWQSQVKVINNNAFGLTIYAQAVNFAPQGEAGHGRFIPVFEEVTEGSTLAEWIDITNNAVTIEPEQSVTIPFTINVPENAEPGGHFAAILISTQPPQTEDIFQVKTSQIVTSLFFVRIAGDVVEKGHIRTFSVEDKFVAVPKADFSLRFENQGNVQLQPQGSITVYNMWGKERGTIPINTQTHFGNVLPESIRKFEFSWEGESSFTDIGRYTAEVSLAYGFDAKKFESKQVEFWVVPVKPMLITLSCFGLVIGLLIWMIRAYIRRMLVIAGLNPDQTNLPTRNVGSRSRVVYEGDVTVGQPKQHKFTAPVQSGFVDLKQRLAGVTAWFEMVHVVFSFVLAYKKFFASLLTLAGIIVLGSWFLSTVSTPQRDYTISIENPDQELSLNAEEVRFQELTVGQPQLNAEMRQNYSLHIINVSESSGAAAETAYKLLQAGYHIDNLSADTSRVEKGSVIVFSPSVQKEALELSKVLGGVLPSAAPDNVLDDKPIITLYVGKDLLLPQ